MNAPVIALINAKGGSGATTLAVEIAKMMKRNGSVAVVDGDLTGRRNMAVILDAVSLFNNARTASAYSVIQTQGMTAVEMTDSLDNSFLLRNDEVDKLVDSLMHHDAIVIDAPQPVLRPRRSAPFHHAVLAFHHLVLRGEFARHARRRARCSATCSDSVFPSLASPSSPICAAAVARSARVN